MTSPPRELPQIAIVIVSHNSDRFLEKCIASVTKHENNKPLIIIVDSGSDDTDYVSKISDQENVVVDFQKNIGFSRANNRGVEICPSGIPFILFLNPDTLFHAPVLDKCLEYMERKEILGCLTGKLLGYDFCSGKATELIDSTGIFRKWYGRWFDRGQGQKDIDQYPDRDDIPAACGAFMFCRRSALEDSKINKGVFFDPDFFLYKEDIELSLRLRKNNWQVRYQPDIIIYHGRGWAKSRREVPHQLKVMAAANEIMLYRKHPSPYIVWALIKYLLVKGLRL